MIDASEVEILGSWKREGGRVTEDRVARRIRNLTESGLERIAVTEDGWEVLYRDPEDGRYWERFYPLGEMQDGGPPALRVLSLEAAEAKYDLHLKRKEVPQSYLGRSAA